MAADKALRAQLAEFVDWRHAHLGFDAAVKGIPPRLRGVVPKGFAHSIWQVVEHIRIAQADILDFCVNPKYVHDMKWPDDYWPRAGVARERSGVDEIARGHPPRPKDDAAARHEPAHRSVREDSARLRPDLHARVAPRRRSRGLPYRADRGHQTRARQLEVAGIRKSSDPQILRSSHPRCSSPSPVTSARRSPTAS